jgi:hypothetical protein
MTDHEQAHGCEEFSGHLAELALGILTGRERAATLAHVESCPRCADELEQLSRAADAVVRVAPEIEPPVGFEVRLFSRMGVVDVTPIRRRPPRWVLGAVAAAAAAVALVVGLSVGLSTGTHTHTPGPSATTKPASTPFAQAALVENGHPVGHVFLYGGSKPWMFMTLADSSAQGHVNCVVVTRDGVTHMVGAFSADGGYGAWGAPLHVAPATVVTAEVVSPNGAVIATAPLG